MIRTLLHWYAAHAGLVFAVALLGALAGERLVVVARRRHVNVGDDVTSVVSGVAFMVARAALSKLVMLSLSLAVYERFRIFDLDLANPLVWIGVFLLRDGIYYGVHRVEHRVRVLWASHLVHHSPEDIGFWTAVRVPWMEAFYKPWLGLWVPLLGFNPAAFVALDVLAAIIGQFQHTTLGRRRTWLDAVFVTPAAHRVHHGSNAEYLDKNFGAVLIVWDRLFGTYAPEVAPVRYGLVGGYELRTPADALRGGYPRLWSAARSQPGLAARGRYLCAPPA